jgi:hypothetical protein
MIPWSIASRVDLVLLRLDVRHFELRDGLGIDLRSDGAVIVLDRSEAGREIESFDDLVTILRLLDEFFDRNPACLPERGWLTIDVSGSAMEDVADGVFSRPLPTRFAALAPQLAKWRAEITQRASEPADALGHKLRISSFGRRFIVDLA